MSKRWFGLFCALSLFQAFGLKAQNNDPVLFSVQGKPVTVSEFRYIYAKTGADKADFTEKSLREYLQLYVDFKLQVQKGYDMGLSDNPQVKAEQATYRKQLAASYLTEREISDKLVKEAYERSKEDREFFHLMLKLGKNASAKEVAETEARMKAIAEQCTAENFAKMVANHSDDISSKAYEGRVGFFTALQLPYALETALYTTEVGKISGIVRSPYGLHLVKVGQVRPAYGQVQVAHLFMRDEEGNQASMDSLYQVLQKGGNFRDLVRLYSQDNLSKGQEGLLGWVSINDYDADFEQVIFALKKDGEYSKPFKSKAGWHIVTRLKALKNPSFNDVKTELKDRVSKDARYQSVMDGLVQRIQKESNFKVNEAVKAELFKTIDGNAQFRTYAWRPDEKMLNDSRELFRLGQDYSVSVKDFATFAVQAAQERFGNQPLTNQIAFDAVFSKLVDNRCLNFEESQLETKYPDFRNLLREYEEGILLFEVKRQLIWDQAPRDTAGLRSFYEANAQKYQWKKRAQVSFYTLRTTDQKLVKSIIKVIKKQKPDAVKTQFNTDNALVQVSEGLYEEGRNPEVDKLKWKNGYMSKALVKDGTTIFTKVEEVIKPTVKDYNDARGYVITDFQTQLESKLLAELRQAYKVEINEDVLKGLIQKK